MTKTIRHLATEYNSDVIAVAEFESKVYIWDVCNNRMITSLDTHLDFGGERLAISSNNMHVAVGSYNRYGVSLYDYSTDKLLWTNKDLNKVHSLKFSPDGELLYAFFDTKPMHTIEARSGIVIGASSGIREIWFNRKSESCLIKSNTKLLLKQSLDTKGGLIIDSESFAVLDCVIASERIYISESVGALMALSTSDGTEIWRVEDDDVNHVNLQLSSDGRYLISVKRNYRTSGTLVHVVYDAVSGVVVSQNELPEEVFLTEFIHGKDKLVCSNGNVYSCVNGLDLIQKIDW